MKKPYLISICSPAPERDHYLKSLPNLRDSVEPVNVELETYPGHLFRWDFIPKELDRERVFIFTDSYDVIFQKPIPTLSPDYIYAANENEIFKNNDFWIEVLSRCPQFNNLNNETIYNVGTFACVGKTMDNWVSFLQSSRSGDINTLDEQLLFNSWLRKPENNSLLKELPDLFTTIYANMEKGTTILNEKNQFVNQNGELYSVVHFNGSTKDLLDEINSKAAK